MRQVELKEERGRRDSAELLYSPSRSFLFLPWRINEVFSLTRDIPPSPYLPTDRNDPVERIKLTVQERRGRPDFLSRLQEMRPSTSPFDRNKLSPSHLPGEKAEDTWVLEDTVFSSDCSYSSVKETVRSSVMGEKGRTGLKRQKVRNNLLEEWEKKSIRDRKKIGWAEQRIYFNFVNSGCKFQVVNLEWLHAGR